MSDSHEVKKAAIAEINRLAKKGKGRITPAELVAAARDESSPLHDYFEWDDGTAAEKYREMQARVMLRACSVKVVIENRRVSVPAYVRDPDVEKHRQGYVETARIRSEEDAAHEALTAEFRRAAGMVDRAKRLAKYFNMQAEFDELAEQMHSISHRIEEFRPDA